MSTWDTADPRPLKGKYTLSFISIGGAGTGKLQLAADGINFVDVTDSSFTGSAQVNIDCGQDDQNIAKWQVVLAGDTICRLLPRQI
jgi:hypothetical protein